MWRLKSWLSDLGVWLWLRFGSKKTYIAFRHTECGSEVVQLGIFRPWAGPEFECFQCNALVPAKDVGFRILSAEEVEKARAESTEDEDYPTAQQLDYYFKSAVLPHVVA